MPSAPRTSKKASCGLTATAWGATASTTPQQKRATSPRSSTGSSSGTGSSPTTSWLRFRSTSAASRSAKVSVATAIRAQDRGRAGAPEGRVARPSCTHRGRARLALQRRLQLAAGAELRHRRRRDLHPLARPRIDALARGARRRRELAEAGEVDRVAALQRLGDGLHEGVDGLTGVALGQVRLLRDLLDEILLRQSLPPDRGLPWSDLANTLTTASDIAQPCAFPAIFRRSEAVRSGTRRTASR